MQEELVRVGIISSVNRADLTAVVKYVQQGFVSGEMKLLQNNSAGEWIPEPGQYVICLLVSGGDGDGVILGGI